MADSRKDFIIQTVEDVFGADGSDVGRALKNNIAVDRFLNDPEVMLLQVYCPKESNEIIATNKACTAEIKTEVHVLKKAKGAVPSVDTKASVLVTTTLESPLWSLYLSLHNIYTPKLVKNPDSKVDDRLKKLMLYLEKGLRNAILQTGRQGKIGDKETDTSGIRSFADEVAFWKQQEQKGGNVGERAGSFLENLDGDRALATKFSELATMEVDDVLRLLEDVQDVLGAVYTDMNFDGPPFPQNRMAHLFEIVGTAIAQHIRETVMKDVDVWKDSMENVDKMIKDSNRLCEHWLTTLVDLTTTDWRGRWKGNKYVDKQLVLLTTRMNEIMELRLSLEQLGVLLSRAQLEKFQVANLSLAFAEIPLLTVGPFTEPKWKAAIRDFDRLMQPIESHVATLLKNRIFTLADRPQLLVGEFRQFEQLLLREGIGHELESERESLLGQLLAHVEDLRSEFDSGSNDYDQVKGLNLSSSVDSIIWAHQISSKVKQTSGVVSRVLPGVNGIENFLSASKDLMDNINQFTHSAFETWTDDLLDALRSGSEDLVLQTSGKLMNLDRSGLKVHYSERLVILLREVRQLSELGFKIPKQIQDVANTGGKFYKHALKLKGVADFYNTISEQIIPSQMGMLLKEAAAFEKAVKDNKNATWDDAEVVDDYMYRLMAVTNALTSRNRKLRSIHSTLADLMCDLLNLDMHSKPIEWKDKVDECRKLFVKEARSNTEASMQAWMSHWDQQLYKAFEFQYRSCLEVVSETKFKINVDLTFSTAQKRLVLKPSLEELRKRYYNYLQAFLDTPKTFKGFTKFKHYDDIPNRNAAEICTVFTGTEDLFVQLKRICESHQDWVVLGTVDIDEYVQTRLTEVPEWEANFKALKKRRKDSERLPDSQKVGCFNVSFIPFKNALDELIERFSDALLLSLKKSAQGDLTRVDEYLESSMKTLSSRPTTLEEMGAAKNEWKEISAKRKEVQRIIQETQKKNTLLKQMLATPLDLSHIKPKWKDFIDCLEAFHDMLDEQRDTLKQGIADRVKECQINVDAFASRWKALKPDVNGVEMTASVSEKILDEIAKWKEEFQMLVDASAKVTADAEHFDDLPQPNFEVLDDVKAEIDEHEASWAIYGEFTTSLDEINNQLWVSYRGKIFDFEDFLTGWNKKLKTQPRGIVLNFITDQTKMYLKVFPILRKVTGELFEKEHWKILFSKIGISSSVSLATLTVGDFLKKKDVMIKAEPEINRLAARAQGEVTIREAVQELRVWAEQTEFALMDHTCVNRTKTFLIKGWKDLFTKVSDQMSLVSSLKESPYFPPFADQANHFEKKLGILDECLHSINQIQRKWVYLEPIFGRGALPAEQPRFDRIDKDFRNIMSQINKNPNVLKLASMPNLQETVKALLDQLERCQKALNDFLEQKRNKFARFYFIGDDDLLEILGQAQNPAVIENHLKKLFMGIHSVNFSEDKTQIIAMKSSKGEVVNLLQSVEITEFVEDWLHNLAVAMEETLSQLLVDCVKECDYNKFPSQILCLAEMVTFTESVEKAIESNTLPDLVNQLQAQLEQLTSTDCSDDRLLQLKVQALVLDLIHNIEVANLLVKKNVTNLAVWEWQKQLRFYIQRGQCIARMCDAEFKYSYEYQGNASKLVHTPLTDKCYLVLTQGMHLGYGGNPYGPAGTGKTESVKALGQALGRQTLVFNCDEGIDFQSMGRIFTGLVKSGAWGCFDEFNRLKEDQLSAVSQQIQQIQAALKKKESSCDLLGKTIDVNFNAAIFVTMNPASKEYGGRSKLPHNLKQLFRAVAMSVPDLGLIAEVIMYSEGFKHAKEIGRKVVEVYQLSKQLLSPQQHYDWGLRALKTILKHGGQLIHRERKSGNEVTREVEATLMIGALKINTLSKLTYADSIRFTALINDVFPGMNSDDIDYKELEMAIRTALDKMELLQVDSQVKKILQLHEALHQRMGVVVVGPSGCGKTVMLNVLHKANELLGKPIVRHCMNPKALEREKLLGHMDPDTREWFDGVLTESARQVMKEGPDVHSWIICDGDVDPEWVESLNSVLDDNHLLTMPNGERIKFGDNVNFVFETHDLQFASPATISRMGMIFLSEEDADVRAILTAWVRREKDEKLQNLMVSWLDELFYQALKWCSDKTPIVKTTKIGLVTTVLTFLRGVKSRGEFVLELIRGMGSNFDIDTRKELANEIFEWAGERAPERSDPLNCYWNEDSGCISSYVEEEAEIDAESLSVRNPPVVGTTGIQYNMDMINKWLVNLDPFIVVGPEGCGKNLLLTNSIKKIPRCSVATVHCSSQTKAANVIQKLNDSCASFSTNKGRTLRPKEGERLVLFLKDLNLPKADEYDTIQLIAFLQQLITYQGFHDDNLEWIAIEKVQIIGSMNPATTVGRSELSPRFSAICNIYYMTYPKQKELESVYTEFLTAVVNLAPKLLDDGWKQRDKLNKLASSMVQVYDVLKKKFNVDDYRHYLFNPRDVTEWTFGLLRYDLGSQNLLDVWAYEAGRLFADRLVDAESKTKFQGILANQLRNTWRYELKSGASYYTSLVAPGENAEGNLGKELGSTLERVPLDNFKELVAEGLYTYQREFKELRMLLFPEVLDNLAFEDRVLSRPGGALLLVGDSGVGRRSSVTLVCHMNHMRMITSNVTLGYDLNAFRNEIKDLLRIVGIDNEKAVFYFEDHQIVDESMLEDINSLLSSGYIPGLFTAAEFDALCVPIKEECAADGRFKNVEEFFISRIQKNLHIVLSMDPSDSLFGLRCESNPAIYNKCTILWMGRWSKYSLQTLPAERLRPMLQMLDDGGFDQLVEHAISIHTTMLEHGATPMKYVAFLDNYMKLFKENENDLETRKKHLKGGLVKLSEAAEMVDELSRDAEVKQQRVSEKQKEADSALEQITKRMAVASERKVEVESIRKSLGAEESKLAERQEQIQNELKEVQPILESAKAAVGGIKKDNLNEIKAFRQPPGPVRDVLAGVLTMIGESDMSWAYMKKLLAKPTFKETILNFDVANVTPAVRNKVQALVDKHANSFIFEKIKRVNVAAAPLAVWVSASLKYATVLQSVKPLRDEFELANRKLDDARQRLIQCEADLKEIDDEVKALKQNFGRTTSEAESLKAQLQKTTEVLQAAEGLLGKLSGEQARWDNQVKGLVEGLETLPSSAMLAAAFVTYLGGYSEDVRTELLAQWKGISNIPSFNFLNFMSTESQLLKWKAEGLPSDSLSMQNGLIISKSAQYPFVIDPNSQATKWLETNMAEQKLEVVLQQDPRFVTTLELSVRFGKTLIIKEVDGVLPMLYPLLRKDLFRQGPRWVVSVGDKVVDYSEDFRLFLITRHANPDLPSNANAIVAAVNFTVTRSGLEGQLLGITLNHEKPELEQQKSQLLAEEEGLKIKLAGLEKRLLEELASSEGNILENKALIDSLDKTKTESLKIATSLKTSKDIQADLDRQREMYRPIAHAGSVLFFLLLQLKAVCNMYNFSLPSFISLFNKNLDNEDESGESRIGRLCNSLKLRVFFFVSRSLFKADRLMFAMHLVHCTNPRQFAENEWELFTGEFIPTGDQNGPKLPNWAQRDCVDAWNAFATTFPGLVRQYQLTQESAWQSWGRNPKCELDFPQTGNGGTPFQRLLLLQALRPDRLQSGMTQYVCDAIGVKSVSPDALNFQGLVNETQPSEPILFITSAGADPTAELEDFAVRHVGKDGFAQLALGSGQTEMALEMLKQAAKEGTWLCLKNLHLVTSWCVELEKTLKACEPKPTFRLWLTTEAHDNFPSILLQQSLKITYESPPGLKANLMRTYEAWDDDYISKGSITRAQMLFVLAWFHALAQERRTFIPQGFTKFYEFSFADLRSGADIIDAMFVKLNKQKSPQVNTEQIPWTTIWGLMKFAIYGGRIDNDHDLRVLITYLGVFFSKATLSAGNGPAQRKLTQGVELPYSNKRDDYIQLIQALSNTDNPAIFGLPDNIEGTVAQSQSSAVLMQLRKLAVSSSLSAKFNRELWGQQLGPILKLWEALSSENNRALIARPARLSRPEEGLSPVDGFVMLECGKAHRVVTQVHTALTALSNVIFGSGLMTPQLLSIGNTLVKGEMPWVWQRNWYGPDEPAWWLKELAARRLALVDWLHKVDNDEVLRNPIKLPELLQPKTFLNALRQETARKTGIAIDQLKLTATWDNNLLPASATVRVTIEGCLLQGCSFNNNLLGPLNAGSPVVCGVPPITFAYVSQSDPEPYPGREGLPVPIYCSTTREEYIDQIRMPCKGAIQKWILSGVALFCAKYT